MILRIMGFKCLLFLIGFLHNPLVLKTLIVCCQMIRTKKTLYNFYHKINLFCNLNLVIISLIWKIVEQIDKIIIYLISWKIIN